MILGLDLDEIKVTKIELSTIDRALHNLKYIEDEITNRKIASQVMSQDLKKSNDNINPLFNSSDT